MKTVLRLNITSEIHGNVWKDFEGVDYADAHARLETYKAEKIEDKHWGHLAYEVTKDGETTQYPATVSFSEQDITAQVIFDIKKEQRKVRLTTHNVDLIAEIGVINEMAMDAGAMSEEAYAAFKSKISVVKDHLTDAAYDKAIEALTAADIPEISPSIKAGFIAKMQAIVAAEQAELNTPKI